MTDFSYQHGFLPKKRVPAPLAWKRTSFGRPEVPMTWHHVIPRASLRHSWNTLARHQTKSDKAQLALHTYMRLLGFDHAGAKRLLAAMARAGLSLEDQERVEVAVTYPAWDVVEGPENRSENPTNHFDEYSAGLTPGELSRQEKLKQLFCGLQIFNEATMGEDNVEPRVFTSLATAMFSIERTLEGVKTVSRFAIRCGRSHHTPAARPRSLQRQSGGRSVAPRMNSSAREGARRRRGFAGGG
jgi:hypothetical protein